jgi:hypothetical protein
MNEPIDLPAFAFVVRKEDEVDLLHHGRRVATLRASDAARFLARARGADALGLQRLMARETGNYRRGNERVAGMHARNRRGSS